MVSTSGIIPPSPHDLVHVRRKEYQELLSTRADVHYGGTSNDTPLKCLYRLYEYILLDLNIPMRNEIEYFWNRHMWAVCDIEDPRDSDPARYAVLSCIPHLLVIAFNNNIEMGLPRDAPSIMTDDQIEEVQRRPKKLEAVPEWTKSVAPLPTLLKIPHLKGGLGSGSELEELDDMQDERASEPFKAKNILIWEPHILFI